jgi:GDA1/CD39 (nucleoside phosphatase) family
MQSMVGNPQPQHFLVETRRRRKLSCLQNRNVLAAIIFLISLVLTIFLLLRLSSSGRFGDDAGEWLQAEKAGKFKKEFTIFHTKASTDLETSQYRYIVAVDAGSTGTRAYVYRWPQKTTHEKKQQLPEFTLTASLRMWPGLSSFGQDLDTLRIYMRTMMHYCGTSIGSSSITKETPVYVYATAGMRLIKDEEQKNIMETVLDTILHGPEAFRIRPEQVQIISGELEGALAWLSVNYMMKTLPEATLSNTPSQAPVSTLGLMDIGGGSMQVAYEVEDYRSAEKLVPVRIHLENGIIKEYRIFSKSLLGFGMNEARKKYHLFEESRYSAPPPTISLACYPKYFIEHVPHKHRPFQGIGDFKACFTQVHHLLKTSSFEETRRQKPMSGKSWATSSSRKPRFVDFLPRPKTPMLVVGVAEYWNAVEDVFHLGTTHTDDSLPSSSVNESVLRKSILDPTLLYKKSANFCASSWDDLLADVASGKLAVTNESGATSFEKLRNQCFKSAWVLSLMDLFFGIKIRHPDLPSSSFAPSDNDIQMVAKNSLGSLPITWAIGVPILHHHLHHL